MDAPAPNRAHARAPARTLLRACFLACLAGCGSGGGGPAAGSDDASPPAPTLLPPTTGALSPTAQYFIAGVTDTPALASASPGPAAGGHTYYVDRNTGNDDSDGLAATAVSGGSGPWRTLARVTRSALGAGDVLRLACGSVWNETLRLPASGARDAPVIVSAAGTCATPPAIDGAIAIPASAWASSRGAVFETPLATPPLLLNASSTTVWTEAHHPNRGHSPAAPDSPYLAAAANSNTVIVNGEPASTDVAIGADLVLPAGVGLDAGLRVRMRPYSWTLGDGSVASVANGRLVLTGSIRGALSTGWGYFLMGRRWMVDSDGEWFHDAVAGKLYASMPGGAPPAQVYATQLPTGIDLRGRGNVIVDGVAVRHVGVGIDLRDSAGALVRNSRIEDTAAEGLDATASSGLTVLNSVFSRTGADAISGWRVGLGMASGMTVRDNVVRESGVRLQGERVLSLPRLSYAAIYAGQDATVTGNAIIDSGYSGIIVRGSSRVEHNFIHGACSVLDDGAGIYTQFADSKPVIRGNTVVHPRGALDGKAPAAAFTQAQGIYLDSHVDGATITDNTVIDADQGIQIHISTRNTVSGNRLFGNRRAQLWMQDTSQLQSPLGDVFDNQVTDNLLAGVEATSPALLLDTLWASTAAFGSFDRNRYFDRTAPTVARQSTASGSRTWSFSGWQSVPDVTLPAQRDPQGSATSNSPRAAFSVSGTNLVPNGALDNGITGWSTFNQVAPAGQILREPCPAGICLRYVAGGSPGVIFSGSFAVRAGQWYRISIDLAAEREQQPVQLMVRRGGGGNNGFESLSAHELGVIAGTAWRRYTLTFQATATVNVNDPVTGDYGARLDIQPLQAGNTVRLANVELVPVTPGGAALLSGVVVNAGASPQSWACPYTGSQAAICGQLLNLADDSAITWPLTLPAYSARVFYGQDPALLDSDGDGIADAQDLCPGTAAGAAVNARGCPLVLR